MRSRGGDIIPLSSWHARRQRERERRRIAIFVGVFIVASLLFGVVLIGLRGGVL